MSIARQLSRFVINAWKNELPGSIKKIIIQAVIDQFAMQIAGSELPWSKAVYTTEKKYHGSSGNSTIARYGDKVSPCQAAFINGSFAHANDFDDAHQEAQAHPGSVVIPAAIALGEHLHATPETVLKSIVYGMEIMLRLAHSVAPACMLNGHHTSPAIGPFGAAIACGLLLELNETQLTNALGICGAYSGGLTEFSLSGGSVKRIYTGLGAKAGLEAALLAREGLTGPETIIEGKKGIWAIHGRGNAYPERLFHRIGEEYLLSSLIFKAWSCCLLIHPAIEAFLTICRTEQLSAQDIDHVSVGLSAFSTSHVGSIIIPKDALGAQFSTSFILAQALIIEAPGMWTDMQANLNHPEIQALSKRISCFTDAEADKNFPAKNGCIVHVNTKDGSTLSYRIDRFENLLAEDAIKNKFTKTVLPVLGLERTHGLYERLMNFEKLDNLVELFG